MIHAPVMLTEVLDRLAPQSGGIYVDGTFGAGGYSRAILNQANCTVYGIDRDPHAIKRGSDLEKETKRRFTIAEGNFADLDQLLSQRGIEGVDGIVFDLGVSSPQLDEAERGFSFQKDGPLDMRMSQEGPTAADLVNGASEARLADIIWHYGDEKKSRQIAKAIIKQRQDRPFTRTLELRDLIHKIIRPHHTQKIDPATKTFQALRIEINQELKSLEDGLWAAVKMLNPKGRLVVVSFHALEDSIVKKFLRLLSGREPNQSRHMPTQDVNSAPAALETKSAKSQKPSHAEVKKNPRARSARLRWAIRTEHPLPENHRKGRPL